MTRSAVGWRWITLVTLLVTNFLHCNGDGATVRQKECDFEEGVCGWRLAEPLDGASLALTTAGAGPGPPTDAAPGTPNGSYVFLNSSSPASRQDLLQFPTFRYICGLSLALYSSAATQLSLLRVNVGPEVIDLPGDGSGWLYFSRHYNLSAVRNEDSVYPLWVVVEGVEMGEAEELLASPLVVAVDNLTLTFCLPCDFDLLALPGNLHITAPLAANVSLGQRTQLRLDAASPLCPTLPLFFLIEAVEPASLSPLLTVNSSSGVISINGTGPHLLAAGASGYVNVSAHVLSSNYTQEGEPYKAVVSIPLEQPPVIRVHVAPANVTVEIGTSFSFQVHAAHLLHSLQPLSYTVHMQPPSLHSDIDAFGQVNGLISVTDLPAVLNSGGALATVEVSNEFGSSLSLNVTLLIPPSPPLPLEDDYSYIVSENHSSVPAQVQLGVVSLVDPNGDPVQWEPKIWADGAFTLLPDQAAACCVYRANLVAVTTQLNYEQRSQYSLTLEVADSADPSLVTTINISISVQPENEYSPHFIVQRKEVIIEDTILVGDLVALFTATDQDDGPGGVVSYNISKGNEEQFFSISRSGKLHVASSPILPGTYTLTVCAFDHGTPPLSTCTVITIAVHSTGGVECSKPEYDVPLISTGSAVTAEVTAGSNYTLYCSYSANPSVALYKWQIISNGHLPPNTLSLVYPTSDLSHYYLSLHQLTIFVVGPGDAGLYICNVTNFCGSATSLHFISVLVGPGQPLGVAIGGAPNPTTLSVSWRAPAGSSLPNVRSDVQGYTVQARLEGGTGEYVGMADVPVNKTKVTISGLLPGNSYSIRVVSNNDAGSTPSDPIIVTLPARAPQLLFLTAAQEANYSLLIRWQLLYDGGQPVTLFSVAIAPRSEQHGGPQGYVFPHVDVVSCQLLSPPLQPGMRYLVSVAIGNNIGTSEYQVTEYVGHVDRVVCDFDWPLSCPWPVEGRVRETEDPIGNILDVTLPFPGSKVVMSFPSAGYTCGYTISYQLKGAELRLQACGEGGVVLWEEDEDTGESWAQVSSLESVDVDYLTDVLGAGLELVATSNEPVAEVRLDQVLLDFCLPCDFTSLRQPGHFVLTYHNSTTLYLRETATLNISASLTNCSNAVLVATVTRVVPSDLWDSFTVSVVGDSVSISVGILSTDLVQPSTAGFIEVLVMVAGSDYSGLPGTAVEGEVQIEFTVQERPRDCAKVLHCGFEDGPCAWRMGLNTFIAQARGYGHWLQLSLNGSVPGQELLTLPIGDDYCSLSLSFSALGAELEAIVSGVGVVWSSRLGVGLGWDHSNASLDLQGVRSMSGRSLSLQLASVWDQNGSISLDNITLYPCIECGAPFEAPCTVCPAGYSCPVSPGDPVPCLPGQFSFEGQSSCQTCPDGFRCPEASLAPQPNSLTSCDNENTVVVVVAIVLGLLLFLFLFCCATLFCCYHRMKKARGVGRKEERRIMAGHGDNASIGTAGSLGRCSVASADDRRRWKKYGESSTLMTFVPEDGEGLTRREISWLEAVEQTWGRREGGGDVLHNPLYREEDEEEEEMEMLPAPWSSPDPPPPPPHPNTESHL